MVLLAGFAALLHRYTGQEDIVVGTPVAGRGRAEWEGTVGLFANTLALRLQVGGKQTFGELLEQVRGRTLEALSHQDVPFEKVVQRVQPVRDLSRNPLFQVMFDAHDAASRELRISGLECQPFPVNVAASRFDLTLDVAVGAEMLEVWVEHRSDVLNQQFTERLIGDFAGVVGAMAAGTDMSISELRMAGPGRSPSHANVASAAAYADLGVRQQLLASRHTQLTPERRALLQRRLSER
jgi:non-ribosomal peptide synthetase component F